MEGPGAGIVGEDGGGGGEDGEEPSAGFVAGDGGALQPADEDGEAGYEAVGEGRGVRATWRRRAA